MFGVHVQHAVKTSSNVTTQAAVYQRHRSATTVMTVETGRMNKKTAVSDTSVTAYMLV